MTTEAPQTRLEPFDRGIFYFLLVLLIAAPLTITVLAPTDAIKWFIIRTGPPALFVVWFAHGLLTGRRTVVWDPIAIFGVALLGTKALSLIGATNAWVGLNEISMQLGLLATYFLVSRLTIHGQERDSVLYALVGVGLATSIYGIAQHFGRDFFTWQQHVEVPTARGTSFLGHATFSASLLIMAIPLALALSATRTMFFARQFSRIAILVMLYHLSFSGARVATVSLVLTALLISVALLYRRRKEGRVVREEDLESTPIIGPVIGLVVVMLLGAFMINRAWSEKESSLFGVLQASVGQRLHTWDTATRLFVQHPANGIGAGNYAIVSPAYWNEVESARYARYQRQMTEVHNEYLETAAEQGVPGILALLGIVAAGLVGSGRIWLYAEDVKNRRIALALFAAIFAASLDATFIFNLQQPGSALVFWVVLGLVSRGLLVCELNGPPKFEAAKAD